MRDFKGMKRQRGRNRGGGGGGNKPQNANRAFDSNGPDGVKVRGNAQHVFEKYQQLARDATSSGDRVLAENYLQHAEHYFRLLRAIQPQRPAAEILGRDQFASGYDIDFEDESVQAQAEAADESAENQGDGETREGGQGRGRDRERGGEWQGRERDRGRDRDRDGGEGRRDRDRDDRQGQGQAQGQGQGQGQGQAQGQAQGEGEGRRDRRDRWRDRRDRDERPRGEDGERRDRAERPERDPLAVVEPQGGPGLGEERGPVLRDAEGGESHAPAFLQVRPEIRPEAAEGEERPAPRRRRRPRSFEAGEGAPGGETEEA